MRRQIVLFLLLSMTDASPGSPWVRVGQAPGSRLEALRFHDGRLLAGTDSGLYRSRDGRRWEEVLTLEGGVTTLAVHGRSLYAGGDLELHRSDDGGSTWDFIRVGDRFSASIRHMNRDYVADEASGLARTSDNGAGWKVLDLGFAHPRVSVLASSAGALFAGGPWGLLRSTDHGETWSELRTGPSVSVNLLAAHRGVLYAAGFPECPVQRSADGGGTWSTLEGLNPLRIGDLAVGDGFVLVATPDGIYRHPEGGGGWTPLPGSEGFWEPKLAPAGADLYVGVGTDIHRLRDFRSAR